MTVHYPDAAPVALPASKSRRLIELDILRGFLLLGMTLTHLPTKVSILSNQTFGFVSNAEGFIFLAAFMIGQIEARNERKSGPFYVLRDILRRTGRIYAYHCALLAIAFTAVAAIAIGFHRLALENLLSFYLQSPRKALIAAALLQYRPALMDILPMYVVFMLLTPLARNIARKLGWETVLFLSFTVWAGAQFGLRDWIYNHMDFLGPRVPQSSTGAFDLYSWQLLWMLGLAFGSTHAESSLAASPNASEAGFHLPGWLVRLSLVVAAVFLALRYAPADHWVNPEVFDALTSKWRFGAVRLIDFAAITLVLVRFGKQIAALPLFRPLASLGQASIQVFSVHVVFCLAALALSGEADPQLPWQVQVIVVSGTISALFITAHIVNRHARTHAGGARLRPQSTIPALRAA